MSLTVFNIQNVDKNTGDYQLVREKNNTDVNQSKCWD